MISTLRTGRFVAGSTPVFSRIAHAYAAWRQRRDLSSLDDHLLRDIGLSRSEAEAEARRPIWDVPASWRR